MKKVLTLFILMISTSIFAQKTYVKITKGEEVMYYPPGTRFELKNPHGYIILKYSQTSRVETIDGNYQLILHPSWRTTPEIIRLTKGDKVELEKTANFGKVKKNPKEIYINQNEIIAEKHLTDSKKFEGKKNLVFELSNGIKFKYQDGEYYAKYRGKKVDILGKYVIPTKKGTLKLSFNPNNGVVWWIFEKK